MLDQTKDIQRISLATVLREKELWMLIFVGILYFYRPLFLGETFFIRDLSSSALPLKQIFVDFIEARELPLWDPSFFGGKPYFADVTTSTLHPFNLFFVFFPLLKAFNLSIVFSFVSCSVFAYLFGRIVGFQRFSSFIIGIVYGFSGYTLSIGNLPGLIVDLPYLPLLFLFWHLFFTEKKRRWFVMAVVAGWIQMISGSHELNMITMLSLLGWTILYPYSAISIFKKISLWVLLGIFITGTALIQIIPMLEVLFQSSRIQVAQDLFSIWSLHPLRLPELFFSGFLLYIEPLSEAAHYWGGNIVDGGMPFIISIYFGCGVLFLGLVGGLERIDRHFFPRRVRIFLLALFVFSLLLAFGRFLPLFNAYYSYISSITLVRYPIRFFITGIFPFALLAGYGAEVYFYAGRKPSVRIVRMCWSILLLLLLFTFLFWVFDDFAEGFQQFFFRQAGEEIVRYGLGITFLHTTAVWCLLSLLYQHRRLRVNHWQAWILTGILTTDLLVAGRSINPLASGTFFTSIPPVVPIIHREIGGGRFFRVEESHENRILHIPTPDNMLWVTRWYLESLSVQTPALYQIPVIFHIDPSGLAPTYSMGLTNILFSLPWEQRLPLFSSGGVTVILAHEEVVVPGMRQIATVPTWSGTTFYLYKNEIATDRVEFVTSWDYVASDEDGLKTMLHPAFDPRRQVVLQKAEASLFDSYPRHSTFPDVAPSFSGNCEPAQINPVTSTSRSTVLTVSNSCDGFLVFSEIFYPGWRVYVNNRRVPILRANYAFSAIFLPPGKHQVKRVYRPLSVMIGGVGSLCFWVILSLIAYNGWLINPNKKYMI